MVAVIAADYAYLAGLMDADGSIVFYRTRRSDQGGAIRFTALLQLEDIAPVIPQWIAKTFGGNFYSYTKHSQFKATWKMYRWQLTGKRAIELLKRIRPFLKLKMRKADILINNETVITSKLPLKPRLEKLESIWEAMRTGLYC